MEPPSRLKKLSMLFRSPMKQSLGMCTASAWHQERLLEARQRLDLRNHSQLSKGMIPVQSPLTTMTTSLSAPSVPVNKPTVTANLTPQLCRHHPYLSPLDPHHPGAWDKLSSIMSKPKHWSLDLLLPLTHTVKIPLKFQGKENHPPNIPQGPEVLTQNLPCKESRFWTYLLEDVKTEDVGDPAQYVMLDQMLTRGQLQQMRGQGKTPSLHHCKGMNLTEVSTISPVRSSTTSGMTSLPNLSNPT
jgi:hypothetical protein